MKRPVYCVQLNENGVFPPVIRIRADTFSVDPDDEEEIKKKGDQLFYRAFMSRQYIFEREGKVVGLVKADHMAALWMEEEKDGKS